MVERKKYDSLENCGDFGYIPPDSLAWQEGSKSVNSINADAIIKSVNNHKKEAVLIAGGVIIASGVAGGIAFEKLKKNKP